MNLQARYTIANLTQLNILRRPILEQFHGLELSDGHAPSDGRNQSDHLELSDAVTNTDSYLDILCDILCCCELWLSELEHIIKESEATKPKDPEIDISDTDKNVAPSTADSSEVAPDCLKHDTGCLIRDFHDQFIFNLEVFIIASEGWLNDVCEMFNITRDLFADTTATTESTVTTETTATPIMTILHPEVIYTLCSKGAVLLDDKKDLESQSQLTYSKTPIIEWSISQLPTTQVDRRKEGGRHTASQLMTEGDWNEGKKLGNAVEKDKNKDVSKDKDDEVDEHGHVDVEEKNNDDREYNRDNDEHCIGVTCTYAEEHGEVTRYMKSGQLHDTMSNTCTFNAKHEDQEAIDNAQTSILNSEINLVPESFEDQIEENAESTLSFSTSFDSEQHVNNVSKLSKYFEAERDQMNCCDTAFNHEVHRFKEGDPIPELKSCNIIQLIPKKLSDDNVRLPCNQQVMDSNHQKLSGNSRSQSASLQMMEEDWEAGKALDKVVDQNKNTDVDENNRDDIDKNREDDKDEYGNDHGDYVVDQNRDEDKEWDRSNDEQKIEVECIDNDEDRDTTRCMDSDKLKEFVLNKCNFIDTCIDKQAMDDAQTCPTSDSEITSALDTSYDDQIEETAEGTLSLGIVQDTKRHVECIKSQKLPLNNVSELSQYFTKEDHSECLEAELDQVNCCKTMCDHEVHRLNENDSTTELQSRDMFQLVPEQLLDDNAPCNQQMMNFSYDKSSGNSRSPSLFSLDLINSDSNEEHEIKSTPDEHSGIFQIDPEQMEQRTSPEDAMLQMVPNGKDDDIIGYNETMNLLSLQPTATTTASEATRIDSNNYQHDDTSATNLSLAYDNSPTSSSQHNHNQYAVPAHSVKEFQQLTNLATKKQDADEDEEIEGTQAFDLGLYGKYTTLKIVQDILFDLVDQAIEFSVDCIESEINLAQDRLDEYEDDTRSLVPYMGSRHDPMLSQGFTYEDNVFATQPFKPQPVRQPYQLSQEKPYRAETNYPSGYPNTKVAMPLEPVSIHDNPDLHTVSGSACVNVNIAYPTSKPPKVRRLNDQLVPGSNPTTRDEESFHHLRGSQNSGGILWQQNKPYDDSMQADAARGGAGGGTSGSSCEESMSATRNYFVNGARRVGLSRRVPCYLKALHPNFKHLREE